MGSATSRDGTRIAYHTSGDGPPLLLVHGTAGDHQRWAPLLPFLEPHFTVHAMDRRGRGGSGDTEPYDLAREYEDVAAVVDAIAAEAGRPVDVYGHSYGGTCALGGAGLTDHVRRLVVYEPVEAEDPDDFTPELAARLAALLEEGRRDAVLEMLLLEGLKLPQDAVDGLRKNASWWDPRVAVAHTIPREVRAGNGELPDPAGVRAPTLLLVGGDSPIIAHERTVALCDALPDGRVAILEGQRHLADALLPDQVARHVLRFLRD